MNYKAMTVLLFLGIFQSAYAQNKESEIFEDLSFQAFQGMGCGPAIALFAPVKSYVLGDTITLHVRPHTLVTLYKCSFSDIMDEIIFEKQGTTSEISIAIKDIRYKKDTLTLYQVRSLTPEKILSNQKGILFYSSEIQARLENEMKIILNDTTYLSPVEKYLTLASFYEKNKLFIEAIHAYAMAFKRGEQTNIVENEYLKFLKKTSPANFYFYKKD